MERSGVYKITSPSGRVYIGQSNNIHRRLIEHKYMSKSNVSKLYSSIKKHGMEAHSLEVLFLSNSSYEKDIMEAFYMNYYNTIETGLNHILPDTPTKSFLGRKHSKEVVDGIKERMKGVKPMWAIDKVKRKIYCGVLDKTFDSGAECARELGVTQPLISMMVNGKRPNKFKLERV